MDVEFIQAEREIWPTASFAEQIREIGVVEEGKWTPKSRGFQDVTKSEAELSRIFFPKIVLAGLSLKSEFNSKAWGGILHRIVANKDYSKLCIIYLLTWTFQRGALSFWFAVAPLALLSLISFILLVGGLPPVNFYIGVSCIGFLFIVSGLKPYFQALITEKEKFLMIHNETWLIFHGLFFTVMSVLEYNVYSLPAIPATPVILGGLTLFLFILRLFQDKLKLATHEMDYEPILIYLVKEGASWIIDKVRFDRFHYIIRTVDRETLLSKNYLEKTDQGERVKLIIDNNWHSMRLMKRDYHEVSQVSMFLFYFFLIDFLLASLTQLITGVTLSVVGLLIGDGALVAEPIIFWITGLLYYAIHPYELVDDSFDPYHPKNQLTDRKLYVLWNLRKESARLIFRLKMQDPFNPEEIFWNSFRDDPLSILLYNVLPRLDEIEAALKKILETK
ncbi:MAG: hypothetical protein OdinLCB4_007350 [Candidatus Odinarchaeum yellowstonii]|uniref:Uncharacterized protein n=1 Tax=Odinarchaeota yellowstonii (strain LCB_4) TaxID=1841599 RepID=A0AAF0D240_ODILC|nr:MAG: hypothetical protein OdinLCB4_007350 [Candidatus Odinarchaeum yellowstonii]